MDFSYLCITICKRFHDEFVQISKRFQSYLKCSSREMVRWRLQCAMWRDIGLPQDDLRQSHMFTLNYRWALNKDMCNCCWYKWLFFSHPMPSRYQTQIEDPNEAETRIKWNLCCVYKSAWRREKKTHTHKHRDRDEKSCICGWYGGLLAFCL